ncbi:hypothetical protein AT00_16650 [Pseudoalteromonas lipolytica SCSIO 04301]|uniref:Uncharacterized protein n=1 Tax=Pseudoalteromonas lipolytica TaxID=570156 RepID=A0ABY1GKN5_9GAMM|nr:hypothetical protein [Pseudoalteromonas lipolytica]EWH05070.1 hypothetical protein AT00_16650 [Pseudoalteromonas lipolytica SCSIO 04301]MBE0349733.1 hypothetical protein [Pseudoalteromonas lipolytica LMEB 39]SFT83197.1 hypothetical protein SAMN04487854_11168 [Pseudoalteromonas lipolytica]
MSTQITALEKVVSLYRLIGCPRVDNGIFTAEIEVTSELKCAMNNCEELSTSYGEFDELLKNNSVDISSPSEISEGDTIKLKWKIATNGSVLFFNSYADLLENHKSVFRGESLDQFYIAQDNVLSTENGENSRLATLTSVVNLISLLSKIAHYHDEKTKEDVFRLVFILTEKDTHKPYVLKTLFHEEDLSLNAIDLSTLNELIEAQECNHAHASEKLGIFRFALANIISQCPPNENVFSYLLKHWSILLKEYKASFDMYISGFSFNKVRTELAKAEIDLASSLSKVMNDITGKLFGIPISLVALISMLKIDSIAENVVLVVGNLLFSLIVSGLVRNQLLLRQSINIGANLTFSTYKVENGSYPYDLKKCLTRSEATFKSQSRFLLLGLWSARIIAWLVTFIAVYIFIEKFGNGSHFWVDFKNLFSNFIDYISNCYVLTYPIIF